MGVNIRITGVLGLIMGVLGLITGVGLITSVGLIMRVGVRGPNGSFGNQTGRMINSSRTTEDKRCGSKTTRV